MYNAVSTRRKNSVSSKSIIAKIGLSRVAQRIIYHRESAAPHCRTPGALFRAARNVPSPMYPFFAVTRTLAGGGECGKGKKQIYDKNRARAMFGRRNIDQGLGLKV